jgi:serine/threonine protein kinase
MISEILDGKYRIDKQLGAGGMGNVYLATHLGTTRVVAIKVIAPRWARDPHFLARFQREAQACGRLRHPNIVNVTDFGIAKASGGNTAYLVMEYLDGQTLSDFQKTQPRPSLPLVADLLDQIGLALAEAHRHGIVHRDLKPDNIWLEPNGRGGYTVKVLDFGVAKMSQFGGWAAPAVDTASVSAQPARPGDELETVVMEHAPAEEAETVAMGSASTGPSSDSFGSDPGGHTMPGSLVGTPVFMSPEQALGRDIDLRSDIYSLAVVAYSLVCGTLPFAGKTTELMAFHQTGSPPPPASVAKIPGDVSDAILAGLSRDPADRPPSVIDFTRRFHNAVDAEFLALRRSKAFLLQHLAGFTLLVCVIYGAIVAVTAIMVFLMRKIVPAVGIRVVLVPLAAAAIFIFAGNLLRAAAALVALDEQVRVRRFVSFRVLWKLIRMLPVLLATQLRSWTSFGAHMVVGDCLWPVVCMVEKRSGRQAVQRSRELMTGLRSAGRALAIRHLALAALAIADLVKSVGFLWQNGRLAESNVVVTASWFPVFALFAAAPLFLYDRTAASQTGPLLQLDRTPEVQTTARRFSISTTIWLILVSIYLLWQPLKFWIFG